MQPRPAHDPQRAPEPMLTVPCRVDRVRRETRDTFTLDLRPARKEGFEFAPGQFNMLYVYGVGESPISISGDPGDPSVLIHTVRSVGTVTRVICAMERGDVIGVRGPYGTSWPIDAAAGQDIVIVGGGIGLAPLRPVLHRVLANREKYGKVCLLYGARTPQDILYTRDLEKLRGRFDFEVQVTVDAAPAGDWRGHVGTVTTLIPRASFDPEKATAFVCGPEIMMRYTARGLLERGMPGNRIMVSTERNMKCGLGLCGHCQLGPVFVCKEGPVFPWPQVYPLFHVREF